MENKKRLIDVDEALKKLRQVEPSLKVVSVVGLKAVPIDAVIQFLERRKTVDAVEVVHGRWIPLEYDGYADGYPVWELWECSECGEEHKGDEDTLTPYCPNCGAKMDGDENGPAQK